ncbi:TATE DNA transposon [Leptomonas pyrrhocoris]|uniref:TATE DNA transposon n=1 Tax=Leptomonas pyrrhocoris TaxID=157538 RepID=A0A0N0DTV2_LEPPY|nr:TATE DNA transposon [Leptomonas pyrrhocoris]KPA77631.1 TATE DNA transposon [Leptomonas pyrrhocoris]|eukprot:XP_015656070.1 TATE DNA transposon [Leptomonas pyrrhocoris]
MKGRRRLITEPLLNSVIRKEEIPRVEYPTRLARRQALRWCRYMLQIDFEAYYDAIPLPGTLRNSFVFRSAAGDYYRLRTLPTGARWSVAVGQAVTWTIVDVDTPVVIMTMIDNILIAARTGQEVPFVRTVRQVVDRIRAANLLTSPDREELARMSDDALLHRAQENNVFLGEEYRWTGTERVVRNSVKTVAKLTLALPARRFSCRSFVSLVSLMLYAIHTTQHVNPARAFTLLRAYRGVYRMVCRGLDWDEELPYLDAGVHASMMQLGRTLLRNEWSTIADERSPTYQDADYDVVCYTDASVGGWGAVVKRRLADAVWRTDLYQQRWVHELAGEFPPFEDDTPGTQQRPPLHVTRNTRNSGHSEDDAYTEEDGGDSFMARHSAHAEPRAAELLLRRLVMEGLADGARVALVTDHFPIVHAQKRLNGFGGIGRGYSLNTLYEYTYDLWRERSIDVVLCYVEGERNPADAFSRHF